MGMLPPQLSRVMNANNPKLTAERFVNLLNYLDTHRPGHTVSFDWLMRGKPRPEPYPVPSDRHRATKDMDNPPPTIQEFRDAADRFAVECHRRGYRRTARAVMDLVDELDGVTDAASNAASFSKANQAVADLAKLHSGKSKT
jgi:hypothetical protein